MKTLQRYRFVLLGITAVGLIAATVITMRSTDAPAPGEERIEGHLGPTPGPNSQAHVDAKKAYLERVAAEDPSEPAAALVSFAKLHTAAEASALVAKMQASAVFVSFPSDEAKALTVETSVDKAMATGAAELKAVVMGEIKGLEAEAASAQGAERESQMKVLAERRAALASIRPDCRCVYAVAVEGATLGELGKLQKSAGVRLVDVPDPVTDDLAGWQLTPILPKA